MTDKEFASIVVRALVAIIKGIIKKYNLPPLRELSTD